MFSRVFLAAGVAALAIAAPASAQKGGHGGGGGNPHNGGGAPAAAQPGGGGGDHGHGGGGGGAAPAFNGGGRGHGGGGGGGFAMPSFNGGGHGHGGGGFAAPQMQRVERQRGPQMRVERQQARQQSRGFERQQARNVQHQQMRGFERQQARNLERQQARNVQHQQARGFDRQQARQQMRGFERQQARNMERQNGNALAREQMRMNTQQAFANQVNQQQFERGNGKMARFADRQVAANLAAPYRTLTYGNDVQIVPVQQVQQFVGVPVAQVPSFLDLSPLPATMQYLYPATQDYYYQYGNGYLYQIDQGSNLIAALIPLLAGGYGVGQLLPSAYSYYNVPMQYRTMYYDTPNYGYWYAPGASYQYDNRSSLLTSVAALLSPGFTIGQQLPMGYDVYNVPYDYRATYYDTPNAWYRYNNGYIYQVDPATQIVTAIVASLLT